MVTKEKIRVVVVDDNRLLREGVRLIVAESEDIEIIEETGEGKDVLPLVQSAKPDVLLLDLVLRDRHGLDILKQVKRKHGDVRVLVLTAYSDDPLIKESLHNGADGYLLKDSGAEELLVAIRALAQGQRYLSSSIVKRISNDVSLALRHEGDDVLDSLSARELIVLRLAADGISTTKIAEHLFISPRTAETHRSNLMRKLALKSQTDLVRFAVRKGIVRLDG